VIALLLAALLSAPAGAATVKILAYDDKGLELDLPGLLGRLARADENPPYDPEKTPFWAFPIDERSAPQRVRLSQKGKIIFAAWSGGPARLELVWPVAEDGYNAVSADNDGAGFADGAAVFLNEEIALTQYRLYKDSWKRRTTDWQPLYEPGKKAKALAEKAKNALADASRQKEPPARAQAFAKALLATALAWEKALFEHGLQNAADERRAKNYRFGLTLDDSLLQRMDDVEWVAEAVKRSGTGWVRLVFRPNGSDFTYSSLRSFNEYDAVMAELEKRGIKVMGCVLDTAQWPKTLTPEAYSDRVKNIVLHFKGKVDSWEVGSEINGDWLGGSSAPLGLEQVYKIFTAGASKAKELDPETETVATLYWWEATAPDREHSFSGWLKTHADKGFGKDIDVVGLALYPEDNPVGLSLERAFDSAAEALPGTKLMLSSFGYIEQDALKGYWWLTPDDADGARKDIAILYTTAACAMAHSLCGGFWWQTLEQMLPPGRHKATDLFKVYRRTLDQLGRKE